ncbi:MAG: phytanoyl-CoA dioxygenase [Rhodospirillaceae bacterium]|nr:phytanoyl-CoA dioxygenase [Rhodospirillaceae bacterium]|tara:strand:+ start:975 stop:1874 length:900 start_codon:yes stop_codon:yes gene_type:complete
MRTEEILEKPARILTKTQREEYFENGFLTMNEIIPNNWVKRLRACSEKLLNKSSLLEASDAAYDLGPRHTKETPHVRRLKALVDRDPVFWEFASDSIMGDIAADLVGPDVKFHSSKLNYKWPGTGELVKWHQDIPAWPHTNYSPVTLGVYLDDVTPKHGPLLCIPKSHKGPLYVHRDAEGNWTGAIFSSDLEGIDIKTAIEALGSAGTLVAINCRTIHGSGVNMSRNVRPLALFVYSSADAFAWMPQPTPTSKTGEIVRGSVAKIAHLEEGVCPVPPDWNKVGYNSIFSAQGDKQSEVK